MSIVKVTSLLCCDVVSLLPALRYVVVSPLPTLRYVEWVDTLLSPGAVVPPTPSLTR